jgi:hypothetical protein
MLWRFYWRGKCWSLQQCSFNTLLWLHAGVAPVPDAEDLPTSADPAVAALNPDAAGEPPEPGKLHLLLMQEMSKRAPFFKHHHTKWTILTRFSLAFKCHFNKVKVSGATSAAEAVAEALQKVSASERKGKGSAKKSGRKGRQEPPAEAEAEAEQAEQDVDSAEEEAAAPAKGKSSSRATKKKKPAKVILTSIARVGRKECGCILPRC